MDKGLKHCGELKNTEEHRILHNLSENNGERKSQINNSNHSDTGE
jgi:hypothetical protein